MRLSEILVGASRAVLPSQREDGSFPAGHNGVYRDPETPVRNTAHWAITLSRAAELTGDDTLAEAARRAVGYLLSRAARPMGATFHCRTNPDKDMCNGLIGQAWAIEGLAVAGRRLEVPGSDAAAREVFLLHPFDRRSGLWRRVNVDGSRSNFDLTFNHQLWFAAAGAMIGDTDPTIVERVERFLERAADGLLRVSRDGRVRHDVAHPLLPERIGGHVRSLRLRRRADAHGPGRATVYKEVGYHAFNLYGLALLREALPDHPVWAAPAISAALGFANRQRYVEALEGNTFGYPYNPAGFEMAYTTQVFSTVPWRHRPEWWVRQQLDHAGVVAPEAGAPDPVTLGARLYEASRLEDLRVDTEGPPLAGAHR